MRIGILTNTYPPSLNGVSVSVESLQNELEKLGHQVYIATPFVEGLEKSDNIFPLRGSKLPDDLSPDLKVPLFYIKQATKFFAEKKIEIIHSHDTMMGGPEAAMIALKLKIPAVHTFHTNVETYSYWPIPGYQVFIRNYIKQVCNSYQHVIVPSEKMYRYLLELGVKVPLTQLFNVPNLQDLQQDESELVSKKLKDLGVTSKDKLILSFCRLALEKGLLEMLDNLSNLLQKNSNFKLVLAGWGPLEEELKSKIKSFGLESQILLYGKYKRQELKALCQRSSLFIFSSRTENLPTNIFEAMYLGLPVVAVEDASVDYLLKDQVNGYKSDSKLAENCEKLLTDSNLQKEFSAQATVTAKQIDPTEIATEHVKIYNLLIHDFKEFSQSADTSITPLNLLKTGYLKLKKTYNGINNSLPF